VFELLAIIVADSIGLFIGASIQNLKHAFVVCVVVMMGLLLLGGFFVKSLPFWLGVWAKWLSFFKYSNDACLRLQFSGNRKFHCQGGTYIEVCKQQHVTIFHGDDALVYLKVGVGIGQNFIVLFGMFIFFRILAYIALRFVKDKSGRV